MGDENRTPQGGENGQGTGAAGQNGSTGQAADQSSNGGQIDYAKIQNVRVGKTLE